MKKELYSEMALIENHHWWFRGRRFIIENLLKSLVRQRLNSALDIGCGTGANSLMLAAIAENVYGMDFNEEALNHALNKNPELIPVLGSFPVHLPAGKKFDLVTMFDVLEHIENDSLAVKKIQDILINGGVAILTVPALPLLWTEHDKLFGHLRRYTKTDLIKLVSEDTSLRIEKISYFNFLLFFPILIFRIFKKIAGLKTGRSDFFAIPRWLNSFLYFLFSIEGFLIRHISLPVGVSIVCVLKKYEE